MRISHDIYAEMNPAFCALLLATFVESYVSTGNRFPDLPLIYIALPLLLSEEYIQQFEGTNKTTGLREWLSRNQNYDLDLSFRLNGCLDIVSEALQFGCFSGYLELKENAQISLGGKFLIKSKIKRIDGELLKIVKCADRLGCWFAHAGSTKAVFDIMGLTV
ncbi:conserved hypothetical protein [Acinetobacter sp. 8I-beige]|uniref:three component ABC system middle component n=1 Tax=Acinetobacter sp. 8I-beige TaxID=2653125 RepID=UPI0012F35EE9|nr:three component ABC system middle component [Acinetobacter sp. 8I-beige]VXA84858.1 conserved hypothetical protein [Acinetobacter sp. 8I-beige]